VAWVFATVLDVEISQVHEIIERCKNHDPPAGGGATRRSAGGSRLVFGGRHLPPSRADNPPTGFWGAGRIISAQKPAEGNRSRNHDYNDKSHFYLRLSSANHALRDELIAYTDLLEAVLFI
jgi:hypothetical protein